MTDVYMAYCINNACYTFGASLEHELDSIDSGKGKPDAKKKRKQTTLNKWLGIEQKFRNPAASGPSKQSRDREL